MGQVLWHVTMSPDGFIAGPRDDLTWLADHLGSNPTADEVLAQVGALLIGDRTYQLAKTEEGKPYGGAWTGPQFVLSHHPPKTPSRLHLSQRRHRRGRGHGQGGCWRQIRRRPWCRHCPLLPQRRGAR
jgi:hypothetical protein